MEPLKFAVMPQLSTGITPNTREAVIWSLGKSYMHWSFAPYATYVVLAFAFGPAQWICNLFTESFGNFISTFVEFITAVSAFSDTGEAVGSVWHHASELWPQWWDEYYFVDFLSFGPIIGLFSILRV